MKTYKTQTLHFLDQENEELFSSRLVHQQQSESSLWVSSQPRGERQVDGRQPGQDMDMLGATALCGYNRVTSVHMVSIEPQSQSQGPSGKESSLGLRDLCQVPWRGECAGPRRARASPGCSPWPSRQPSLVLTSVMRRLERLGPRQRHHLK